MQHIMSFINVSSAVDGDTDDDMMLSHKMGTMTVVRIK